MIENIDKVLDRGDRLELLVDKTANMQGNTFRFRKQARRFRSTVWWRNVKLTYVLEPKLLCTLKLALERRWMEHFFYASISVVSVDISVWSSVYFESYKGVIRINYFISLDWFASFLNNLI